MELELVPMLNGSGLEAYIWLKKSIGVNYGGIDESRS